MNANFPMPVGKLFKRNCIIKILGILRVYRYSECIPEIFSLPKLLLGNALWYALSFSFSLR